MMKKVFLFILALITLTSCIKESVEPLWEVETWDKELITFDYHAKGLEVDRVGEDIGDIPVVGSIFQRLAEALADISIENEDGLEVIIDPQVLNVPELNEVDFTYIKLISLSSVQVLSVQRSSAKESVGSTLKFIKKIKVYLKAEKAIGSSDGAVTEGHGQLVLSYDKAKIDEASNCQRTCLDFHVHDLNWKEVLMENRKFTISIKLEIDETPKKDLQLNAHIQFKVGIDSSL